MYTYPVTFSVKKPDGWGVIYYDSGIFPTGTVFIAPNNFTKYPSVWDFNDQTDSATGVSITGMPVSTYNQPWARGTMGPVQFFTSKYSGTYRVRLIDHDSALCTPYKIKSKHKKLERTMLRSDFFAEKSSHALSFLLFRLGYSRRRTSAFRVQKPNPFRFQFSI